MSALVKFEDVTLHLEAHAAHEWLISTTEVAAAFGVDPAQIRQAKARMSDSGEIVEGKHFAQGGVDEVYGGSLPTMWTKRGVIRLGFNLRSDRARRFRDFAEDLVIERAAAPQFAIPRTYAEALMAAATLAVEGERKDARIAELEPAAAFTTELVAAAGDFDVRAAAQILNRDPNIRMGEGRLFAYLRGEGWIDRDNRPYQRHVDAGRLVERMRPWHNGKTGQSGVDHQARITVKGVRDLHGKLRGTAPIVFATQAELLPGHAS